MHGGYKMNNKIKKIIKTISLGIICSLLFSINIFAAAGILPYCKDTNTGEILILIGYDKHRKGWTDFGGGRHNGETNEQTAAREGHEESLGELGSETDILNKVNNTKHVIQTGAYSCYLIPVNYVPAWSLRKALKKQQFQAPRFQEKSDFTWINLNDLCNAIQSAQNLNNVSINSNYTGKIKNLNLFNEFAKTCSMGLNILKTIK